ncbi:MAG: hypothetical protein JST89_20060 [Cyanobacteria bacterium SZAS-4]|nr:hypothetical protein [Cyanobacteria bacterium SZAS-4]
MLIILAMDLSHPSEWENSDKRLRLVIVSIGRTPATIELVTAAMHAGFTSRKRKRTSSHRPSRGNQIADLGPSLWIVFMILFFPLLTFGTLGLRYAFLSNAARLASSAGAQCSTFFADANPPKDVSAVNLSRVIANRSVNKFSGVSIGRVDCYIVTCPLAGGATTRQDTPLAKPADTNTNSYNFQVVVTGQLSPLIPSQIKWFSQIPGLSAPINTSASSSVFFENTQGLTQ